MIYKLERLCYGSLGTKESYSFCTEDATLVLAHEEVIHIC